MSKKTIKVLAIIAILALCVTALVACNSYKWDSIGKADSSATPTSNGGYFVKQGNFAYFINGYVGESTDGNGWGNAIKGAVVRASLNADGTIDNSSCKVLVPKNVYTSTSGTGIAIYGEWIYYATSNFDKDKNGSESTTDLDFMRTKTDGSVTQKIGTISDRSAQYKFTPSRVIYYTSSTLYYIDFSGMKTNKSIDNGKGTSSGKLAENVASVKFDYADTYQNGGVEDYIFYTQTITGANSYKNYNELYAIKYDGSNKTLLATETTYLGANETATDNPTKVFKFSLVGLYFDDASTATLYYTKSFYKDSADTNCGLYMAQFKNNNLDVANEKQLNSISSTTIFPLGYAKGCLAYNSDSIYCWYNGQPGTAENPVQVNENASATVWYVDGNYAYYTDSDGEELFKIDYTSKSNVESAVVACMKIDWYPLEFDGKYMYYYTDEDNNYLYCVDVTNYDPDKEETFGKMVGIYLDSEIPSEDDDEE